MKHKRFRTYLVLILWLPVLLVLTADVLAQALPCVASAMFYDYPNAMKTNCAISWDMHPNSKVTSGAVEWTPMAYNQPRYAAAGGDATAATILTASYANGYILVGNECNVASQCNMSPGWFATWLHNRVPVWRSINPNVKVIIGGVIIHSDVTSGGETWLNNVRSAYIANWGLNAWLADTDGFHFHVYPDIDPHRPQRIFVSQAIDDMHYARIWTSQNGGGETWITEIGCLSSTCANGPFGGQPNWMRDYAAALRAHLNAHPEDGTRVYWYTDYSAGSPSWTWAQNSNGSLTPVGVAWSGN